MYTQHMLVVTGEEEQLDKGRDNIVNNTADE